MRDERKARDRKERDELTARQHELYGTEAPTEAPTFVFHMNRKGDLHPSDMRWLENTVRSQWAFTGTPLRMVLQVRDTRRKRRIREGTGSKGYQGSNRKSRAELIGRR